MPPDYIDLETGCTAAEMDESRMPEYPMEIETQTLAGFSQRRVA